MARSEEREERGFKYRRRTPEDVKARANMKGGGFDSIFKPKYKVMKVRDGKNLIRILPATWKDAPHYGYDLWINYGIGVDNQSYLSLSAMKKEKDPLEEARREAERSGDKELAKQLRPRQRILLWVIDRNDEDEGPQLFACPFSLDKAIAALSFDEDTKATVYVEDPKEGADIRFYKEGTGLKTDYPAEKIRILKESPLHDDKGQAREWLDYVQDNPLPECLQFYDYDHIANTFDGQARTERDEDDDEKPRTRARSNGKDEDDDERPTRSRARDDEEDDGKPAPRARANRNAEADEDDERPRRTRVADDAEETAVEEPRRGRSRIQSDEAEDEEVKPRGSIRDRLSRSRRTSDEDDD